MNYNENAKRLNKAVRAYGTSIGRGGIFEECVNIKFYVARCGRCGNSNRLAEDTDANEMLINEITLSTLNVHQEQIPELEGDTYYICNDCWNDLLDFLSGEGD